MSQKVLVTGANGLIGSATIAALENQFDLIKSVREVARGTAHYFSGDISDKTWPERMASHVVQTIKDLDFIVHLAGQPTVWKSVKDPYTDASFNVLSTLNIICLARQLSVKKIIFSSSEAVFGGQVRVCEGAAHQPLNPYGISKSCAEEYLRWYEANSDTKCYIVRPSFVLGDGFTRNIVYDLMYSNLKESVPARFSFSDESIFNFVDARCVAGTIRALLEDEIDEKELHVVGEKEYSVREVSSILSDIHGKPFLYQCTDEPPRIASLKSRYLSLYRPYQFSLEESLRSLKM